MYLLTDSEENWIVTGTESNLRNEVNSVTFEITEDESASEQTPDTDEYR